jgi:AcrR family transcriptional regulator
VTASEESAATDDASPTERPGRRRTLRTVQKEQTREMLVGAARQVFEARGYADATVDDIVALTGASRGTFYVHFPSKAAIMAELILRETQGAAAQLRRDVPDYLSSVEGLEAWLRRYVDSFRQRRDFLRAWAQAEAIEPSLKHLRFLNMHDRVERYHAAVERAGLADPRSDGERSTDILLFVAAADNVMRLWLLDGLDVDGDHLVRRLARLWYLAVYGTLPPSRGAAPRKRRRG